MEVAAADFAMDVKTCEKWIKFGNGRTTTSNGENSYGNIFDFREEFSSLGPLFSVIDRYRVTEHKAAPPSSWLHGNFSVQSPGVTNTHAKHKDGLNPTELFIKETFGMETKRVRIAVSVTPPEGVHEGRVKETRYAHEGQDVLRVFASRKFSFTVNMMGPRATARNPSIFPMTKNDKEHAITLLNDDHVYGEEDEDEGESITSVHMKHGVYNNANGFTVMFDFSIKAGKRFLPSFFFLLRRLHPYACTRFSPVGISTCPTFLPRTQKRRTTHGGSQDI
jgi:hypothetical protein